MKPDAVAEQTPAAETQAATPSISLDELVQLVHDTNTWERRITCLYHPDATGEPVHSAKFGGIRTEVGPAGYAVSVKVKEEKTGFVKHETQRVALDDSPADTDLA